MKDDARRTEKEKRFRDVHKLCYSSLFSAVYSKVARFEDAEDLTQEIFLRLYDCLDEVDAPRAWLYGTMRNVLKDYYKGKGRSEEDIDTLLDESSLGYVNGFRDARIVITDILKDPESFGSELNRSIFELVSVYGFSLAEAARDCGITYNQARWAYSAAAQRIISVLRNRGISKLEDLL